jgi:hypothetical protein
MRVPFFFRNRFLPGPVALLLFGFSFRVVSESRVPEWFETRARFIFSPVGYIVPPPLFFRATVSLAFLIIGTECRCRPSSHFLSSSDPRLTRGHHSTIDRVSSCFLPALHEEKGKGRDSYVLFLKWRHSSNDFHLFEKGLAYVILTAGTTYYYRCCCWQRFISIPWTGGRKNSEIKWFSLEENHSVHMCVTFVCIHIFNIYLVF